MCKLLSANCYRLWRNKIFWLEAGFTFIFSAYICFVNYLPEIQMTDNRIYLDDVFFIYYQIIGFVIASAISMIVGTEYSDGTIRNKIAVGYTRTQIYFSNMFTCIISSIVVLVIHGLITGVIGYALFGAFLMPVSQVLFVLFCAVLIIIVYTAITVLIAMNCANKPTTVVISLLLMLGFVYVGSYLGAMLMEKEMTNPTYVSGGRRRLYEFLYDILPTGQLNQMYYKDFSHAVCWPWYSIGLSFFVTVAGCLSFCKKDIR